MNEWNEWTDEMIRHIEEMRVQENLDIISGKEREIQDCKTTLDDEAWTKSPGWIIEDWLQRGEVHMITGMGGVGKSRLVLQLCAELAKPEQELQSSWIPAFERGSAAIATAPIRVADMQLWNGLKVLTVFLEDGEAKIARRIKRINKSIHTSQDFEDVYQGRWKLRFDRGYGPIWERNKWTKLGERIMRDAMGSSDNSNEPVDVLVIDTLGYAFGDNENDRAAVSRFSGALAAVAESQNIAIILVAHPSKGHSDYSGSTAWHGNVRGLWTMGRTEKGAAHERQFSKHYRLHLSKSSDGLSGKTMWIDSDAGGLFYGCKDNGGWITESGYAIPSDDPEPPKPNRYANKKSAIR